MDDIDGTVVEEKISHAGGATTGQYLEKKDLLGIIRKAGKVPVERDTVYNVIKQYETNNE